MPIAGKEYKMAIRIAGVIDKSFGMSLKTADMQMKEIKKTVNAIDKDFVMMDKGFDNAMKTGKQCFNAMASAAKVAALAISAVTGASVAVGSEFESAFAGVKKTVDATEAEYAKLREDIIEMSKIIPSSAADIAKVMEIAGQLGIKKQSLTEFTETMIELGVSTNMSAEEAATALAKFANIVSMDDYGADGISNWERLGSVVVDLGNNFATTEADIVTMATNLASTGDLVGMTEAQIMALSTGMSSVGIAAEKGGSTMSKLIKKMQIAVEMNTGALTDYASVAGMTGEEFSRVFKEDAVEALAAFIDGLQDTERNGKSAIAILDDLGLNEIRLSNTILALSGAEGLMTKAINVANEAWSENTALAVEAGKRYETFESQAVLMKNSFKDLGIAIYDGLSREPILHVIQEITNAVNSFTKNRLPEWIQKISVGLPTVNRHVKNAWKVMEPFAKGVMNLGKWVVKNGDYILTFLAAIGSAMLMYKIESKLMHVFKFLSSLPAMAASMNPVTIGIISFTAAISALGLAIAEYKVWRQNLVDDSLAEHFGNISLSMEELQRIAEEIVGTDKIGMFADAINAFGKADEIAESISGVVESLNKENWKVSIGMVLTENEQQGYQDAIAEYVSKMQDYALQEQYAVYLNLAIGEDETSDIALKVNQFYQNSYDEMESLGKELSSAVNDAFADKILDPDEIEKIADLQAKMADLQASMATSELDAQMIKLGAQFSGTDLNAESFQNLQDAIAEQVAAAEETYLESYARNVSAIKNTYNGGGINYQEYQDALLAEEKKYLDNIASAYQAGYEFQFNAIYDAYSGDINVAIEEAMGYNTGNQWDGEWWSDMMLLLSGDKDFRTVRDSVSQLLEAMEPTIEEMERLRGRYEELGMEIPEILANNLYNVRVLKGITEMSEDAYLAIGEQIAKGNYDGVYEYILGTEGNEDYFIPEELKEGIRQGEIELEEAAAAAAESFQGCAEEAFRNAHDGWVAYSQAYIDDWCKNFGFYADANVNVALNPYYSWNTGSMSEMAEIGLNLGNVMHNANGGIWTKPILTTFAENGPEAAIPIDGSKNAVSLWEQTGRLLGMDSILDGISVEGGTDTVIEYSPVLNFYGEAPSRDDINDALKVSQDEFAKLMEGYIKEHGRVTFE